MKKFIYVMAITFSVLMFAGCTKVDKSGLDTKETIVIGLDDTFAPMGFRDIKTGEIIGFDIDLATEVLTKMGKKVEFKAIDWNSKEAELKNRAIDLIWNGLTITEERKKNMAFSDPYFEGKQVVVTKGASTFTKVENLNDKKIGVQLDSTGAAAMAKALPNKELTKFDDYILAFQALKNGQVDAVVVDQMYAGYYLKQNSNSGLEINKNLAFEQEEIGVGASLENQEFLNEISKQIADLKANGKYAEIQQKWFEGF